ncbi:endonuclease/exonuclease/phosphatase family protein [Cooperia oncophora]
MLEMSSDPRMHEMILALQEKLVQTVSSTLEEDRKVVLGYRKEPRELPASRRQTELEDKIGGILDILDIECRPESVYRMGAFSDSKTRLVKVLLPSKFHWSKVLANARLLRRSTMSDVFIRRSMSTEERAMDYKLRQQAKELNKSAGFKEWVVYKSELKKTSELPSIRAGKPSVMRGNCTHLRCFLFNSRSLVNKLSLLHAFVAINDPDLLLVTETWLDERTSDTEVLGGLNYKLIRSDRGCQRGGGVCCLVRDDLRLQVSPNRHKQSSFDVLWFDITSEFSTEPLRLAVVYRPPQSTANDDNELIDSLYDICSTTNPTVITGDFNLSIDWENDKAVKGADMRFKEAFECCELKQWVKSFTRGESVLDLILSSGTKTGNVLLSGTLIIIL